MTEYLLGLATLPALAIVALVLLSIARWLLWWRDQESGARKGFSHDLDTFENGRWFEGTRHTHWWPADTPNLLIRRFEPLRIRLCLHDPNHRPTGTEGDRA